MNSTQGVDFNTNRYSSSVKTGEVPSTQERVGNPPASPVIPIQQSQQAQIASQQPVAAVNAPVVASSSGSVAIADDVDVIEKEWVDKAKSIVNQTKGDPYHQEKQVSELQADYLKKRYNKSVKLAG
ncbi:hypothetical protein H6801_02595 [Candidatus Nomurabacteria bacterium]|nr:hypothetical protein [Candidatus Saccharibacteria bacterium]MCB9822230.1 hypothetical protein [Candidatus Nomurabacteria bacterium]